MRYGIVIDTDVKAVGVISESGRSVGRCHPVDIAEIIDAWRMGNWELVESICKRIVGD